ncbi:MAG: hypothetical protein WC003_00400 [Terrimicrobiaceae bacterium]
MLERENSILVGQCEKVQLNAGTGTPSVPEGNCVLLLGRGKSNLKGI